MSAADVAATVVLVGVGVLAVVMAWKSMDHDGED